MRRWTVAEGRHDNDRRRSAHSLTGRRRAPLGWLPWAALALLGLLGAAAFLIARNVGDAGDEPGVDVVDDAAAPGQDPPGLDPNRNDGADAGGAPDSTAATVNSTAAAGSTPPVTTVAGAAATAASSPSSAQPAATTTPAAAVGSAGGGSGGGLATGSASLTAGGQAILPLPAGGLAPLSTTAVSGTSVPVESVVSDEGFWVGTSASERVFVVLTPEARGGAGESPFQVQAGQSINLAGTLVPLPAAGAGALGVEAAEGGDQLATQGHVVEATQVALS